MMKGRTVPAKKKVPRGVVPEAFNDLHNLWHLETVGERLGEIASALDRMAKVAAMGVIAEHGSPEDREIALGYLKGWFEEFRSV